MFNRSETRRKIQFHVQFFPSEWNEPWNKKKKEKLDDE